MIIPHEVLEFIRFSYYTLSPLEDKDKCGIFNTFSRQVWLVRHTYISFQTKDHDYHQEGYPDKAS